MKLILACTIISSLLLAVLAVNGVDIANPYPASTFTCLKNNGNTFAIIRAFRSSGILDANAVSNLNNARSAGLTTDIYMFPCRGKDPAAQVSSLVSGISGNLYGSVWIDVQTNPTSGCSWSGYSATSNCDFLLSLINGLAAQGKSVGIYSSLSMWQSIFGSSSACTTASKVPLWYAHYDNLQAFSDFKPFAGWTTPKLKQFAGDVSLCSADIDKNWRP